MYAHPSFVGARTFAEKKCGTDIGFVHHMSVLDHYASLVRADGLRSVSLSCNSCHIYLRVSAKKKKNGRLEKKANPV
jgi:hypothetical protein